MKLVQHADCPMPDGADIVPVHTVDGVTLRAAIWRPWEPRPRGTVLILQGRAEFIEKYVEVVEEVLRRGFAVATFDWRGQGGSTRAPGDRHLGHVRHFSDFRRDLDAVAVQVLAELPGPVVALAHSMGGCIALTAASEGWLPASRLVATTPMIGLSLVKYARITRTLVRILSALGLSARMVPGGQTRSISTLPFPGNRLTGDAARYTRNAALAVALGEGAVGSPTIGWVAAAYEAMARFAEEGFGAAIAMPVLVVGAGDDPVCSTADTERFVEGLPPGSYLLIPGARHEVLMENDGIRSVFWAAFDGFVSAGEAPQHGLVQARVAAGHDPAAAIR